MEQPSTDVSTNPNTVNFTFPEKTQAERVFADAEVKRIIGHTILDNQEDLQILREKVEAVVKTELDPNYTVTEEYFNNLVSDRLGIYIKEEERNRQENVERQYLEKKLVETEKKAAFDQFNMLRAEYYFDIGTKRMKVMVENAQEKELPLPRFDVLRIDLIGFKGVNDLKGHRTGDEYLRRVGEILNVAVPYNKNNDCIVSRPGGDEFSMLLIDFSDQELEELQANLKLTLNQLTFTNYIEQNDDDDQAASMGIAKWDPSDAIDLALLDEKADHAALKYRQAYYSQPNRNRRSRS